MIWRKEKTPAQPEETIRGFDDFELRLGDILRGERATVGKSLLDVQRELHIRATYVAAIENGDLDAFETPSFIAGFVRSYARYLGMDPEWVYERFCLEHNFQVAHGMSAGGIGTSQPRAARSTDAPGTTLGGGLRGVGLLPDPDPFWKRIEPGALGSVSVLVALIAGLGYAGWAVLQEVQRVNVAPSDAVPNVLSDFDPLNGAGAQVGSLAALETDPLAGVPYTQSDSVTVTADATVTGPAEGVVRIARPEALDFPRLVPREGPIASIVPQTREPEAQPLATDAAVAAALAAGDATEVAVPQVLASGPPVVEILAVRASWMRVRAADGSVVFERILDAGERYTIPQTEEPPTLHAGNSGSVYFLVNGEPFGPAAPGARVVRNISLDEDAIRSSYQVADLTRDEDLAVHVARLRDQ